MFIYHQHVHILIVLQSVMEGLAWKALGLHFLQHHLHRHLALPILTVQHVFQHWKNNTHVVLLDLPPFILPVQSRTLLTLLHYLFTLIDVLKWNLIRKSKPSLHKQKYYPSLAKTDQSQQITSSDIPLPFLSEVWIVNSLLHVLIDQQVSQVTAYLGRVIFAESNIVPQNVHRETAGSLRCPLVLMHLCNVLRQLQILLLLTAVQ